MPVHFEYSPTPELSEISDSTRRDAVVTSGSREHVVAFYKSYEGWTLLAIAAE